MNARILIFTALLLISGCADTPNRDAFSSANDAIRKQDWVTAYRMIELELISSNPRNRQGALALVEQYPEIRMGARQAFSIEALTASYKLYGNMALTAEKHRLDYYQRSIATPEEYEQAAKNFHAALGVWASLEDEVQAAMKPFTGQGSATDLLAIIAKPQTPRKQIISMLGKPSGIFENTSILTWWLKLKDDEYSVKSDLSGDVTHSLVLVFDQNAELSEHALVKIER